MSAIQMFRYSGRIAAMCEPSPPPKSSTLSSGDTGRRRRNSSPRLARAFREALRTACFSKLRIGCWFDSLRYVPALFGVHFSCGWVHWIGSCGGCGRCRRGRCSCDCDSAETRLDWRSGSTTLATHAQSLLCASARTLRSLSLPSETAQAQLACDTDHCLPRCW
jgi:hypothetical protein